MVAGTNAPFWSEFVALADDQGRRDLAPIYGSPGGSLDFSPFFDLIAVHEIAHLFHQGVVIFPRLWLAEFFANLCLHAFVERHEPESLATLLTLPEVGTRIPATALEYRTRNEFERVYASMSGPNYAWYQFRLQLAARDLYRAAGETAIPRLFEAFRLEDGSLASELGRRVSPVLGQLAVDL